MTRKSHPVALSIAGSDCSAGAGIQADLKTMQDHGVHGLSAITSIVAETPHEVRRTEPVDIALLQSQINILLESYPVAAVKTGMLPTRMSIIAVAEIFRDKRIPMVVDPVMIASTGSPLLDDGAAGALAERLFPCACLVTPNIPEAESILKRSIGTGEEIEEAACDIAEQYGISCLLKGGHLTQQGGHLDILRHDGKTHYYRHQHLDLPVAGIHGTGCALSSAVAAGLACNHPMETAVEHAIRYVQQLMTKAYCWQQPDGPDIQCLGWPNGHAGQTSD